MPLVVAPCSAEAARYACEHWHYSGTLPPGRSVRFGVWEDSRYIGAVVFARRAARNLGRPYGLGQDECVELVRVALREHRSEVSRLVSLALRSLRLTNPGLRLCVSFADPNEGHVGTIYQAAGWLHLGQSPATKFFRTPDGRLLHPRQTTASGTIVEFGRVRSCPRRSDCTAVPMQGKHRYVMPLDKAMRRKLAPLAQPYPRSRGLDSETPDLRSGSAGATPADCSACLTPTGVPVEGR